MLGTLRQCRGGRICEHGFGDVIFHMCPVLTTFSPLSGSFTYSILFKNIQHYSWHPMTLASWSQLIGMRTSGMGRTVWSGRRLVWELWSAQERTSWLKHVFSLCKCEDETHNGASTGGHGRNQDTCRGRAGNRFPDEQKQWQENSESRGEHVEWGRSS